MKKRNPRTPKLWEAIGILAIILAMLIVFNVVIYIDTPIALFAAVVLAGAFAVYLGHSFNSVEKMMITGLNGSTMVILFNFLIGLIIASWIASGIIPYIIYLGLGWLKPALVPVLALVMCAAMSLIIGSSWTTAGTMGLAFVGIGVSLGIPIGVMAGAVISGAMFGDKQSPLSETTTLAAGVSKVRVFDHVASMRFTSVPAIIVSVVIFIVLGIYYSSTGTVDQSEVEVIRTALSETFHFNVLLLLMPVLLIVLLVKKINPIACLIMAICAGILIAVFYQRIGIEDLAIILADGMDAGSDVEFVNEICAKGGINAMWWMISIIIMGFSMSKILLETETFSVLVKALSKTIASTTSVVVSSLCTAIILTVCTANAYISSMITASAFGEFFDRIGLDRRVLSRTIEDGSTVILIAPWDSTVVFFCSLFGCTFADWRLFYVMGWLSPLFTILCAITGFGIFYTNKKKGWGKDKYSPKKNEPIPVEVTEAYYKELDQ